MFLSVFLFSRLLVHKFFTFRFSLFLFLLRVGLICSYLGYAVFLFLLPRHPSQGVRVLIFLQMDPVAFLFVSKNGESAFLFRVLNRYTSLNDGQKSFPGGRTFQNDDF